MVKENDTGHMPVDQSLPKRRNVLRSVATGLTAAVGFGGVASAEQVPQDSTEVETVNVDIDAALQKLESVINSPLFEALVSEGHLSEQSIDELPTHRLEDDTQLGGITRLRINGELEQLNFHKEVDGERLEINLPLSDYEPKAVLHKEDGSSIVYQSENRFQGELLTEIITDDSVGTMDHCSGYRYCTTCVACCGYDNWSRIEEQIECPNCWSGHCQWVKIGCC